MINPWKILIPALFLQNCGANVLNKRTTDQSIAEEDLSITGGAIDSEFTNVGYMNCSATLIGARTVLTAEHCVTNKTSVTVTFGKESIPSVAIHALSGSLSNDIAIVILARQPLGIKPATLNIAPVSRGQAITIVGYGITDYRTREGLGVRRYADQSISEVLTDYYKIKGGKNLCYGDSGGPSFVKINGEQRVAGVHSATSKCREGFDTRVDTHVKQIVEMSGGDVVLPK